MRKTQVLRRNLLVAFAALGITAGVLHPVDAEAKETTTAGGGASASGDGGGEITASVTVEYVTAGSGGDGGGVTSSSSETVTVDPLCKYVRFMSPAEFAARGGANAHGVTGDIAMTPYTGRGLPDYEKHKHDSGGAGTCGLARCCTWPLLLVAPLCPRRRGLRMRGKSVNSTRIILMRSSGLSPAPAHRLLVSRQVDSHGPRGRW